MPKKKSFITQSVFFLIALALLFLFLNAPIPAVKEISQFNLLLIGTLGSFVFIGGMQAKSFFEVKDSTDFFNDAALGVIFGIIAMLIAVFFLGLIGFVFNLLGSIDASTIASFSLEQKLFVEWIFPFTETIILIGGTLVLWQFFFKRFKYGVIPSVLIIMLLFAGFHFNDRGREFYEYSVSGFINFIGETENLGTPNYHGVMPQFLLGGLWIVLGLGFKSWVVAAFAHVANNVISVGHMIGFTDLSVLVSLVILGGIAIIVYKKNRFIELKTWNWKGLTTNA